MRTGTVCRVASAYLPCPSSFFAEGLCPRSAGTSDGSCIRPTTAPFFVYLPCPRSYFAEGLCPRSAGPSDSSCIRPTTAPFFGKIQGQKVRRVLNWFNGQ